MAASAGVENSSEMTAVGFSGLTGPGFLNKRLPLCPIGRYNDKDRPRELKIIRKGVRFENFRLCKNPADDVTCAVPWCEKILKHSEGRI